MSRSLSRITLRAAISAMACLVLASHAHAGGPFAECLDEFPQRAVPLLPANSGGRDLCFDGFAVLHSARTRTPVYVVERLNAARVEAARENRRTDRFYEEARLPSRERSGMVDYSNSGYDRGHMAPAGDMPNARAMAQSFSLANVVPQNPDNNRGLWAKIERDTRKYAARASGDVFVFTGPVFDADAATIGSGVAVPSHLYKLVYDAGRRRAWAFWVPNAPNVRAPERIGYDELVRRTGIRFLPATPPSS